MNFWSLFQYRVFALLRVALWQPVGGYLARTLLVHLGDEAASFY
jgi:hypothetical protein